MTRYSPSRNYWTAGAAALVLAGVSAWFALRWTPSWIVTLLFLFSAGLLFFLALRPAIEIHTHYLRVGKRAFPWGEIQRVDRTGWISPLVVYLTLSGDQRLALIYPGDPDSANSLLRSVRRGAHGALIDGVPYTEFWGIPNEELASAVSERKPLVSPKYKMLLEEDEAEVERLYQRLKTVGHLDSKDES